MTKASNSEKIQITCMGFNNEKKTAEKANVCA